MNDRLVSWLMAGLLLTAAVARADPLPSNVGGAAGAIQVSPREELPQPAPRPPGEPQPLRFPPTPAAATTETPPVHAAPLSQQFRVHVRQFRFEGNRVFTDAELGEIAAPYQGRAITSNELHALRHQLTLHYIKAGYLNSGCVIPDQRVENGVITLRLVEGRLTELELSGNSGLPDHYYTDRLALAGDPLHVGRLQERLVLLRDSELVDRVNAALVPGARPGEARLEVQVQEARPWGFEVGVNNSRPPSVGSLRGEVAGWHRNLTGHADSLQLRLGLTEGLEDGELRYAIPLNRYDTTLELAYIRSDSAIVEPPFELLEIESELDTWQLTLRHPFIHTPRENLSLMVRGEHKRNRTWLLGVPFTLSPGAVEGETRATVVRAGPVWVRREARQAWSAALTASFGVDALGATIHPSSPDGRFTALTGQFHYARLLNQVGTQLVVRGVAQWSDDPLLAMEKLPIGGMGTVRGYRENQLVGDRGVSGSVELRHPFWRPEVPFLNSGREPEPVYLALFADYGAVRQVEGENPPVQEISSVGLGVRWDPTPRIHTALYWGHALREIPAFRRDLQDDGLHFEIGWKF